jgi:monoamine oxidase
MSATEDLDAVVVGAGLSGLTAADALVKAGLRVRVLEARPAVGGRLESTAVAGAVANLGAEWIGRRHLRMRRLADELGLRLAPTRFLGGRVRWQPSDPAAGSRLPALGASAGIRLARAFWQAHRLAAPLSPSHPWEAEGAARLDRLSFGEWLREHGVAGDAYRLLDAFVGDLVSRPISDLSLLHVLWWVRRNGGSLRAFRSAFEYRVEEGSQELARRLAARFADRIALGTRVEAIEQSSGAVLVGAAGGGELRARRAILALPTIRLPDLRFEPELDPANLRLASSLSIGPATKVVAALGGDGRSLPRAAIGGRRLTACWRYGSQLVGFARPPHDRAAGAELESDLAAAFGVERESFVETAVRRWTEEPTIGGCDVCFMPGQLSSLGPLLRRDHGLVHIAGPERSSWPNNMEGALESGEAAAARVLASLA